MKLIMRKLGYDGEPLQYGTRRVCGIWFIYIGIIIILSMFSAYESQVMNGGLFGFGYCLGFYLCYGNRKILFNRLATSEQTTFQRRMSNLAVGVLFAFCTIFGLFSWLTHQNPRTVWLLIFLAVGIHFLMFYFVHGIPVVLLGIYTCIVAIVGLVFVDIPFSRFAFLDAAGKMFVGIYFLINSVLCRNKK